MEHQSQHEDQEHEEFYSLDGFLLEVNTEHEKRLRAEHGMRMVREFQEHIVSSHEHTEDRLTRNYVHRELQKIFNQAEKWMPGDPDPTWHKKS